MVALSLLMVVAAVDAVPVRAQGAGPDSTSSLSLPVSLDRIRRALREAPAADRPGALRIDYHINVYGQAPRLDVLAGVDLEHGDVPGTAPTHHDMRQFWTPQEFRAPAADFLSLAVLAVKQIIRTQKDK